MDIVERTVSWIDETGAVVVLLVTVLSDCETYGTSDRLCPLRKVGGDGARVFELLVVFGGASYSAAEK